VNIALPGRRPLAALLAFILLVAGLAFIAPAQSASAAGNNSGYASEFLKIVNKKRTNAGLDPFLANESISKFAAEYVALLAKNREDEEPATALPAGFSAGEDANGYVFGGSSTSSRFSYAKTNFPGNSNFGPVVDGNYNYGAVGVYTTSSRVYVYIVALQYNTLIFSKYGTPSISGTVKVGTQLTAKTGTYSPAADSYTYQWKVNGTEVGSASTFTPLPEHKGKKVTLTVSAAKSGYLASPAKTTSAKTVAIGTAKLSGLTIGGNRNVGQTLYVSGLSISPTAAQDDMDPSYQWYRSGKKITNATNSSYQQVAADRGKKITLTVTATGDGYKSTSISSKTSTATGYPLQSLKPTPTISGTVTYKQVVTVNPGTWDAGTTLSYQWYAGGKAISKATKSTYTIASGDVGKQLTVKVTSTKSQFATSSSTSAASASVAALTFESAGTAAITGDFVKGKTLTASVTGTSPAATYSYQWYKSDTNTKISGATKSKLTLTQTHINYGSVNVKISVKKAGYSTVVLSAMRGAL
jgi:hypothetical protein